MNETRKERRGFASMSAEKQREIASKGGRAAHQKGTAHEWSSDEAREAGRKGGMASRGGRGKLPITSQGSPLSPVSSPNDTEPAAKAATRSCCRSQIAFPGKSAICKRTGARTVQVSPPRGCSLGLDLSHFDASVVKTRTGAEIRQRIRYERIRRHSVGGVASPDAFRHRNRPGSNEARQSRV